MSGTQETVLADKDMQDRLEQAVEWFMRVRSESARVEDLPQLQHWMQRDSRNALAYSQVSATWHDVGVHASAPEVMAGRSSALRKASNRWPRLFYRSLYARRFSLAAGIAGLGVVGALVAWLALAQRASIYETQLGERRTLTLTDGSVVTLDARSRLRVRYTDEARVIALEAGQARFEVAADPVRPFRVQAGKQTIVALGTQFNVEWVANTVLVTLIEGRVAVHTGSAAIAAKTPAPTAVELTPGQQLIAAPNKRAEIRTGIDIERATAWQSGKVVFDNEPLASAAVRINRYARHPIEVDSSVSALSISGIFNAGDTEAFTDAVTTYFPVQVTRMDNSTLRLSAN